MAEKRERKRKHDWMVEDCYHIPRGYCDLKKYSCRNCNEVHTCAMYLPPSIKDAECKGREAQHGK